MMQARIVAIATATASFNGSMPAWMGAVDGPKLAAALEPIIKPVLQPRYYIVLSTKYI